jgi:hypothetical protein
MSTTLQLVRPFRLADAAWPYQIVLDGEAVAEIRNRGRIERPIAAGTHTLQIRSLHIINGRLRFASRLATFDLADDQRAEFVCHGRPFAQAPYWWVTCLRGNRNQWIVLDRLQPPAGATA